MTDDTIRTWTAAIPIPALVLDGQGQVLETNAALVALFGQIAVGRTYLTALRQPAVVQTIETCGRTRSPSEGMFETVGAQGEQRFKVTASPYGDAAQSRILVCFEDISHLHTAGRMRRDFVANVSHELRTPLTAVIGFIETLQGPARHDPKAQTRFLDLMLNEAQRMDRLVGDLLALSRVEASERVRPNLPVDLGAVLRGSFSTLQAEASKAQVALTLNLPDDGAQVLGDEDQLRQIFNNLIENAIKYGGAGGKVTVDVSDPLKDPQLRVMVHKVSVRDKGKGIATHHLPRLTERFYRVDQHRSREMGGTGLGLAIVKHILSRHRGRLEINSALGIGTDFHVFLPTV